MPELIVVSGSINAGKSTVSGLLVERLQQGRRRTAHVQGDALRHFVTRLPLEDAVPVTLQNIAAVSKSFLMAGFDVVVDYPLYRPDYEGLCKALSETAATIHAFTLSLALEVAQSQRGERVLTHTRSRASPTATAPGSTTPASVSASIMLGRHRRRRLSSSCST